VPSPGLHSTPRKTLPPRAPSPAASEKLKCCHSERGCAAHPSRRACPERSRRDPCTSSRRLAHPPRISLTIAWNNIPRSQPKGGSSAFVLIGNRKQESICHSDPERVQRAEGEESAFSSTRASSSGGEARGPSGRLRYLDHSSGNPRLAISGASKSTPCTVGAEMISPASPSRISLATNHPDHHVEQHPSFPPRPPLESAPDRPQVDQNT